MGLLRLLGPNEKKIRRDTVIATLERLRKNRIQLHLAEPQCDQVLTFIISKIDSTKNSMELLSLAPDTSLPPSDNICYSLVTLPNNVENAKLSTQLMGCKNEGLDLFYFAIPEHIESIEQRMSKRTAVSINQNFQTIINDINGMPCIGRLEDISIAGMKTCFEGDLRENLKADGVKRLCNVELKDGTQIEHTLEIVYVSYNGTSKTTVIGCKFCEVNEKQKRELFTFISNLHLKQFHKYL